MKIMFETVADIGEKLSKCFAEHQGRDVEIKDIFARYYGNKIFDSRPIMNTLFAFAPQVLAFFNVAYFDKSVRKFFISVFEEAFNARQKENIEKPRDFLDLLVQLVKDNDVLDDQGNGPKLDDKNRTSEINTVAQSFVFFAAGFQPSSSAASCCLYKLAANPEMQEKLRLEIQGAIRKHDGLTYESLKDMPYLSKVMDETQRKYTSVMILHRVYTEKIDLPTTNLHVEKGMDIIIPVLALHNDPEIWPDPEKFDPERFSPENVASRHPYSYLPFGLGPRNCIGLKFGLMQTKIAIIPALTTCRFKVSPKTVLPLKIDPGSLVVQIPKNPIILEAIPL